MTNNEKRITPTSTRLAISVDGYFILGICASGLRISLYGKKGLQWHSIKN